MTTFMFVAAAMTALALVWLVPVLLRKRSAVETVGTSASNVAVLRDQLAELERDVASGVLSPEQAQSARDELQRRVLEDAREGNAGGAVAGSGSERWIALGLAFVIPALAVLLYLQIGNPDAIISTAMEGSGAEHQVTPEQVDSMVARLVARLEKEPEDVAGWVLLARSHIMRNRYDDAVRAFERATSLVKDDASLFADYADALAMAQGRRIEGKALELVEQALKLDPLHWKALAMAGSAAFERKDYPKAIGYWEKLQTRAEPGSEFARMVASNLEEARQLGGIKAAPAKPAPVQAAASVTGASIKGTVSLAPALAAKASPTDSVFIFARPAEGSRMPLAILRRQVSDLPITFTLDDSMAMTPQSRLSNFKEVVVGARISKSGGAASQSGDLEGISPKLTLTGSPVNLIIDRIVP